jgi:hypothetical protein
MGEKRTAKFGGDNEGNIQLKTPGCRWDNNIKMNLREVGCGGMNSIHERGNELSSSI